MANGVVYLGGVPLRTIDNGDGTWSLATSQQGGAPTVAGENHVGEVGGNSRIITPTLAVTAAAYSANNCVGGLLTLTNAMRISSGSGLLQSVLIIDRANQKAALDILIFNASPAGTFTDKAAFPTLSLADDLLVIRRISIGASDYVTIGGTAFATIPALSKVVQASGSANLYAAMVTTGTPTYAATTDLIVRFGFLRD
jgi:hypothetical protein